MQRFLCSLLLVAATLSAQVTEIPAMTQPTSVVDMDAVGSAGPTTLAAIMTAGTNGGALLLGITLLPSTAAVGVYNTNTTLGLGLGHDRANNQLILVAPNGSFDAFDAQIDLLLPSTEFGIAIGDWVSTMVLEFKSLGLSVGTITSSTYSSANAKFFHSVQPFDQVTIRASTAAGNWVIPELHLQNGYAWHPYGTGCPGSNGTPWLTNRSAPQSGTAFTLEVGNLRTTGGLFGVAIGFSNTNAPGLGALPFDLMPFGAPGCLLLTDIAASVFLPHAGATGTFAWNLPAGQAFTGLAFFTQAFGLDAAANTLGLTTTNAGAGTIQ